MDGIRRMKKVRNTAGFLPWCRGRTSPLPAGVSEAGDLAEHTPPAGGPSRDRALDGQPAVHPEHLAGNVAGAVAGQEQHRCRNILRLAGAA